MVKSKRRELAKAHHAQMLEKFPCEITESIKGSFIVDNVNDLTKQVESVKVINQDVIKTISDYSKYDNVCVLNFASFTKPGGGYINGSIAQEENLCANSILYEVLSSQKEYYKENASNVRNGLYVSRAIISENVLFHDNDYNPIAKVKVISCAAPNFKSCKKFGVDIKVLYNAMENRIRMVLSHAQSDILILGAWGTGVFGWYPYNIAKMFKENILKYSSSKHIIFAIHDYKYYAFKEVLKEMGVFIE